MSNTSVPFNAKHTIRDLRVRAGLSQDMASSMLGISRRTLQSWENDPTKMSIKKMNMIAKLYDVSTDFIFFGPNSAFADKWKNQAF